MASVSSGVDPHDPATNVPAAASGAFGVRQGNRVRIHIDGVAAFGRIRDAVRAARTSVWVTVAFVSDGFRFPGTRESFMDLLDETPSAGSM